MRFFEVNPDRFIKPARAEPAHGRGAWTRTGIEFDYRYALPPAGQTTPRIGTVAEKSLDHWAVAAGCYAIQRRLVAVGAMTATATSSRGVFNQHTKDGLITFQAANSDPQTQAPLVDDGTAGISDARALFTPLILDAERSHGIPDRLLLGETNHESRIDPGAVGYFIYYPDYRGVDRGVSQINSKAHPDVTWEQAFDPAFCFDWSAARLRSYFNQFRKVNTKVADTVLWDAAVCAHNNPSAGLLWARNGFPPTDQAAAYVAAVRAARY